MVNTTINERIKRIAEKLYNGNVNEMCKAIGVKQATMSNIVAGRKSKPSFEVINAIINNSSINSDWLITGEGSMLQKDVRDEAFRIPYPNVKMIPLVSQYAQAGYLCGFADEEYMETLPTIPFIVDHEPHGNYVVFEVKGDSMYNGSFDSLTEGDLLMCREIPFDHWKNKLFINKWKNFVVVHKTEGILVKKIINHNVEQGVITLHSLNPIYKDIEICLSEVAQLFSVVKIMRSGDK